MNTSSLKQLKEKSGIKPSESMTDLMKEQAHMKNIISKALASTPKTIPEVASELGLEKKSVTWYVLTMTRYKLLRPVSKEKNGYWKYQLAKKGE